ncbi:hypothetical protein [Peribacillus loiseleuriae]|uniref:Uncharacterized protein n=1 Tax=Peribacillus loiseleuriae TaxID=1679170 RepID=A0A0K9GTP4_9BACI|nr:hypothetical protein [Peribacillus loiseleuriae]KMY50054.1 hypothetical protein AC625_11490 [Peribacillus loiseleuriae]
MGQHALDEKIIALKDQVVYWRKGITYPQHLSRSKIDEDVMPIEMNIMIQEIFKFVRVDI